MNTPKTGAGAIQTSFRDELAETVTVSLKDGASAKVLSDLSPLAFHVQSKFETFKNARRPHEERWMNAWNNFRGKPGMTPAFISTEKSKAFIKISKTKVLAAYGQLLEVVFAQDKIPIEITSTPEPMGAPEYAHIDLDDPINPETADGSGMPSVPVLGHPGDGNDLKPGETIADRIVGWVKDKFSEVAKIKEGPGTNPNRIIIKPAEEAAAFANKRVHDQFEEMEVITVFRQAAFELPLFGSGILKGPFTVNKGLANWDEEGTYSPINKDLPNLTHVSIWALYLDPECRTFKEVQKGGSAIQRHKLSESELIALKKSPGFRHTAIDAVLQNMPNYVRESFENILDENNGSVTNDRYEVLEFWGPITKALVDRQGADLGFAWPDGVDEMQCNIWVCGDQWLRFVLNPFTPFRLPYYIAPYEFNPYSPYGVGVVENMEDTQALMNGFIRLAVDNAVLSGSLMLELDESVMSPGQNYVIETGKIFRKNVQTQQAAVRPIVITNTSQPIMQMFDAVRRLADEATGIPSFSHGQTGVSGVGRTAGGISMLLGAASTAIKTVVKNCDDYWFMPIGKSMYYWNMNNDFDKRLLGDVSIVAKGSASLMQKEVKSQRLLQYGQIVGAIPMASAWLNWKQWNKELGMSMEVDTKTLLNSPEEYQLQLQMQMLMNQKQQAQQAPQEQSAVSAPGGQPIGAPAQPGQQGFSGTTQPQGDMNAASPDAGPSQVPG